MKALFTIIIAIVTFSAFSQVTFIIESLPENTPEEDFIYIAGDFNGWNPGLAEYQMTKNTEGNWEITLEAQEDGTTIQFKFTRGDWGKVEKDANGNDIPNRYFTFGNAAIESIEIGGWADLTGGNSTATDNVIILDADFYIPQLNRYRRIWVYLPLYYENSAQYYPVLYMHDGQNLFDDLTSYAGEWGIDEALNELESEGYKVPIVVGIDNGGEHRLDEYSVWLNSSYGGGEGDAYIRFIVETLKPHIDSLFRTKPEAVFTGIMGSSLGGFISQYAVLKYPDVFSKGGLLSPSYWYSDSVWAFTEDYGNYHNQRIYQIVGSEEGGTMTNDMNEMHEILLNKGFPNTHLFSKVVQGQGHNEAFWRSEFKDAYLWLFDDFASGLEELSSSKTPLIYPNPSFHQIYFLMDKLDSLKIFDIYGNLVVEEINYSKSSLDVKQLDQGIYFLELSSDHKKYCTKFLKM